MEKVAGDGFKVVQDGSFVWLLLAMAPKFWGCRFLGTVFRRCLKLVFGNINLGFVRVKFCHLVFVNIKK